MALIFRSNNDLLLADDIFLKQFQVSNQTTSPYQGQHINLGQVRK